MADTEYLELNNISKSFGAVEALKGVSFSVRKGEIHTLLGENGAGKSTLLKIIKGEYIPDNGDIRLDGELIKEYSPAYSRNLGIEIVHQELAVFENMTVAENIFPASDFLTKHGQVDFRKMNQMAAESLKMFDLDVKPEEKVENLSLAKQQIVEILRAISRNKNIILLDEPTSGLKSKEANRLIKILKQLKEKGITIIYISHRILEVMSLSDRITVLKDGQFIQTYNNNKELTEKQLISSMVGREFSKTLYYRKKEITDGERKIFLSVSDFSKHKSIQNISFDLYKGEVLGIFGLEGSGVHDLSRQIFGLEKHDKGNLHINGKHIKKITPGELIKQGVIYLNNNRKQAGLLLDMSASDNIALTMMKNVSRFFFINQKSLLVFTRHFIGLFSIVIPSTRTVPRKLSGGNQQKLMMAVCLATDPECLIINEPTRGVDVGAKVEIHKSILALAKKDKSLLVFSSELPELISLSDRILVVKSNQLVGELTGKNITEEKVMRYAAGSGID